MSAPIKLLVADDHPAFRLGLVAMLQGLEDIIVAAQATDGQQAVEIFKRDRPDVTLMDLRMPRLSGVEAILAIRREFPDARIIVLTTFDSDEDVFRAMQSGAKSYLLKDVSRDEVVETIRAVHAGREVLPAAIASVLSQRLTRESLTQRELEVLELLVKGRSNKEIATDLAIAEVTVKFHLKSLFAKMGALDRTQAAIAAIRQGIVHLE